MDVKVAKTKDVPPGKSIGVEVDGKKVLLANVDGRFYAVDAVCSHMGGDLTKGKFDGRIVTCPRHGAQYDVTTGELVKDVGFAAKAINLGKGALGQTTYSVTVDGDSVTISA